MYGIPIGPPSQVPGAEVGVEAGAAPIDPMIAAEFAATGSASTRWFHGLSGREHGPAAGGAPRRAQSGASAERVDSLQPRSRCDRSSEPRTGGATPRPSA